MQKHVFMSKLVHICLKSWMDSF